MTWRGSGSSTMADTFPVSAKESFLPRGAAPTVRFPVARHPGFSLHQEKENP